jgi:hypothetical protein
MLFPHQPSSTSRCELSHAAGLSEGCPGLECTYWDDGHGCILGGLRPELGKHPDLVSLLMGIREQLRPPALQHTIGLPGLDL